MDRIVEVWAGGKRTTSRDLAGINVTEWIVDGHIPYTSTMIQTRDGDSGVGARPTSADIPTGYALVPGGTGRHGKPRGARVNRRDDARYPYTIGVNDYYYSLSKAPLRPPFPHTWFGVGERAKVIERTGMDTEVDPYIYTLGTTPVKTSNPAHWWREVTEDAGATIDDFDAENWYTGHTKHLSLIHI